MPSKIRTRISPSIPATISSSCAKSVLGKPASASPRRPVIQLTILSGSKAGTRCEARRFPFVVGRGPSCSLVLEEPGVWDQHLEIHYRESLTLVAGPEALVNLNGE